MHLQVWQRLDHYGTVNKFVRKRKGGPDGPAHYTSRGRIALLEESVSKMGALSTSVEKLALSMESMVKEQEKQGKRLEALESRDGEMWRKVVGYVVTVVVGAFLGYVLTKIGL